VKHFDAAAEWLAPLPDVFAGIALAPLRADLAVASEAARRWRDGEACRLEAPPPRLDYKP
jgi:predicted TIM-barrel fold metal-dependent hydrolase